ncbi:NAD(P)-dependent dehydrogenase (short-subunit alcohol dehydrogenase family) [Lentzea atacamensis]|uniref:NAD(P)-dependent dehydrogenase (Short-subunit alcohol dehydrogenase family) n=2 Tax=Lentzea TaxID=165301 RepID=A0A316IX11_9PSEU|nr:SDR family oxidoreductase [Lentzea atacamensis]PWK91695.1 NAD(P)-dependent dehydrogenase (short-subunit alcohol dehydrogenase family) [Lentzea atacamensis]RAS63743.1 NAD(P)-dependent dehydrogenase (short-subunit alcohol dehydrogenase family) [Lentzea atacamensis]
MGILDGKAVVITGAGRGLGEAYAMHAALAGASVVVNDNDGDLAERVAEHIRGYGGRAVASTHTVADPSEAAKIVDLCVDEFGRVDGLVNNAGLNYETAPWEDDPETIRQVVEVNVLGVIYVGIAAMRAMRTSGGGSIINISSGASFGQRKLATYSATKGAVASLSYSWALDLEAEGIRVNAVCPVAHTRMVWKSERSLRAIPADRTPGKVAPLVLFLLSDRAEGITGQVIRCNGRQLHIVGQPYFKQPILESDNWDTASVERAFTGVLQAHLEPYGLEKRMPPRLRALVEPSQTA